MDQIRRRERERQYQTKLTRRETSRSPSPISRSMYNIKSIGHNNLNHTKLKQNRESKNYSPMTRN